MKKLITIFILFTIVLGAVYAQSSDPDYYTKAFREQPTVRGKLGIVQSANSSGKGTTEFYAFALDSLLMEYQNVSGNQEVKAADDMAMILSAKLAEAQHKEAGLNLWRVVETFSNPLVKAEALVALGKAQATSFIPQVIQLLSDLNLEPGKNPRERERTAFGAIIALDEFKDPAGYPQVFLASTGWYAERIKARAREALPNIMDNPTEPLVTIIKSPSYNFSVKLSALQTLEAADAASPQEKSQGAVAALAHAWGTNTNLVGQKSILMSTRKLALSMIRRYGTDDDSAYQLIDNCYWRGSDEEEKIAAVGVFAALATDEAVKRLSAYVYEINTRLDRGTLTKNDERLIRVVIPALGQTGHPQARDALETILYKDWTSTVIVLARDALNKLPE